MSRSNTMPGTAMPREAFLLDTIRVLEEIQKIDLNIAATEEEKKRYLRDIETAEAEAKTLAAEKEKAATEIADINTRIRDLDEEMRKCSDKVKKDEGRISGIKNSKELNALNKEISSANKSRRLYEEEKTRFAAKLDEKTASCGALEAKLNDKSALLMRLNEEVASKNAVWSEIVSKNSAQKENAKTRINPDILKKYEGIRAKRGGVGLARVKDETCLGCFIHIPPQVYIILKRGTNELMTCPHCHRILYVEAPKT